MIIAQDVVKELCKMGLKDVCVEYSQDKGMLYYNLNTGAKSGLHLYEDLSVEGRYEHIREKYCPNDHMESILHGLYWMFDSCLFGRDYYNSQWKEIGVKLGILEKKVETITTTTYV